MADAGGAVGMTLCPGKCQPHGLTGAWQRDLDLDLAAIVASGAVALVTLMEARELEDVGVPPDLLRRKAEALGLEWHHLPIADAGVPEEVFEDRWVYSGARLQARLRQGDRVVVHCLGGLGRSGTIAARLLVELGWEPDAAIEAIRAARPGAIETGPQERYVRACRPRPPGATPVAATERALACLLGGAVGDAFGYAVEFDRLSAIRGRFGPAGLQEPLRQGGRLIVSDDTQMTLFTLEGLLRALDLSDAPGEDAVVEEVRRAYLDWLDTQRGVDVTRQQAGWLASQPALQAARAPGNTCLSALSRGGAGRPDRPINDSKGCGAVMRVAPAGLLPRYADAAAAFRLGVATGALTHGHPSGYLSAGAMAAIVRLLMDGTAPVAAAREATVLLKAWTGHEQTAEAIDAALSLAARRSADHTAAVRSLGEGWVGEEALAIGLFATLAADSFPEAVRIAANHDGDSDSTASIAGQLYGAWRGPAEIPHDWVMDLDVLEPLLRLARALGLRQFGTT